MSERVFPREKKKQEKNRKETERINVNKRRQIERKPKKQRGACIDFYDKNTRAKKKVWHFFFVFVSW